MTVNTELEMPTAEWFAALPYERKVNAIQGSYLWKLAHDEDRLWDKLSRHADHSEAHYFNRRYELGDLTVVQMLDRVPDMLMQGFILMATSALLDSLEVLAQVLRKYVPEVIAEIATKYEQIEPYIIDRMTKRMAAGRDRATGALNAENIRAQAWKALQEIREDNPEAAAEIDRAWRMNARAEYMLREILKITAGDY